MRITMDLKDGEWGTHSGILINENRKADPGNLSDLMNKFDFVDFSGSVGWSMSDRLKKELVLKAFKQAVDKRYPHVVLIFSG